MKVNDVTAGLYLVKDAYGNPTRLVEVTDPTPISGPRLGLTRNTRKDHVLARWVNEDWSTGAEYPRPARVLTRRTDREEIEADRAQRKALRLKAEAERQADDELWAKLQELFPFLKDQYRTTSGRITVTTRFLAELLGVQP